MLAKIIIEGLLFIDIETVPIAKGFFDLSEAMQEIWYEKMKKTNGDDCDPAQLYLDQAGLWPEFAKIACVSFGGFKGKDFYVSSLYGDNEIAILKGLETIVKKNLCGHNIDSFDVPFITRRYIITGMTLPSSFDNYGKKPWELTSVDTMSLWKMGGYSDKNRSLDWMCVVLGIPSPKNAVDGSKVSELFYEGRHDEIAKYCEGDVIATARLLQRIQNRQWVKDEYINSGIKTIKLMLKK